MAAQVAAPVRAFEIPEKIPPGNWLAHQLRLINMKSEGLIPESARSKRSYDKYNTVTKIDFVPQDGIQTEEQKMEQEVGCGDQNVCVHVRIQCHSLQLPGHYFDTIGPSSTILWQRTTDECSIPETNVLSILLFQFHFKICMSVLARSLFFAFEMIK